MAWANKTLRVIVSHRQRNPEIITLATCSAENQKTIKSFTDHQEPPETLAECPGDDSETYTPISETGTFHYFR